MLSRLPHRVFVQLLVDRMGTAPAVLRPNWHSEGMQPWPCWTLERPLSLREQSTSCVSTAEAARKALSAFGCVFRTQQVYCPECRARLPWPELRSLHSPLGEQLGARRLHMGGCQNYGPLLGSLHTRCCIILRTQKGTIILTTTHMSHGQNSLKWDYI